jgi:hypothetical protein
MLPGAAILPVKCGGTKTYFERIFMMIEIIIGMFIAYT